VTAERPTHERATDERVTAERVTAERATDERPTHERATHERSTPLAVEHRIRRCILRAMSRSAGLDALRAFACAMVVAFHLHTVAGVGFGPLDSFVDGGDSGVYVFFALSGYLLYRPFLREGATDLRAYAIKRAARILPGYFLALVALTLLTSNPLPAEHPLPFLAIASSYSIPLRSFMGSAWTLSAEVLFYVTLPLIATAARGREVRVLGELATFSMLAAIALRAALSSGNEWLVGSYPVVMYAFVPGMLLAVVEQKRPIGFRRLAAWPVAALGVALLALGTIAHAIPLALAPTIGGALLMGWLLQHRVPGARGLAFLGGMSYATYLWHKDLLIAFGPVGLVIALAGAAASWALLERPILAWAHRIAGTRTPAPAPEHLLPTTVGT
jgi:peptidoglycan/LPS O-acetylase OafA/YrhL